MSSLVELGELMKACEQIAKDAEQTIARCRVPYHSIRRLKATAAASRARARRVRAMIDAAQ